MARTEKALIVLVRVGSLEARLSVGTEVGMIGRWRSLHVPRAEQA